MRRHPAAAGTCGIGLLALAALTAGCGGRADAGGVATLEGTANTPTVAERAEGSEVDLEEALLAFAACMREHGLDLPDPDFTVDGVAGMGRGGPFPGIGLEVFQDPAFQEANEACRGVFAGLLPQGEDPPGGG
ncbi:MAG: hypothetical protein ABIJ48_11785 [Actinomycetota bacterium]